MSCSWLQNWQVDLDPIFLKDLGVKWTLFDTKYVANRLAFWWAQDCVLLTIWSCYNSFIKKFLSKYEFC